MTRAQKDALHATAFVAAMTLLLGQIDAFEAWLELTRSNEDWELDELPGVALAAALAGFWFAHRRLGETRQELARRRAAERELLESRDLTRQVIDAVPALVSFIDSDLRYRLNNRRYETMTGRPRDEIQGQPVETVMHPASYRDARPLMLRALEGETIESVEQIRTWGGEERYAQINYVPRRTETGAVEGFFVHVMDVTARKRAELDMRRLKEDAERANAAKSRFLAAASHDLRQPLHAVRLLIEAIEMEKDRERMLEILGSIRTGIESMGGMLNALLDVSEIESGSITPARQDVPVQSVLESLADRVEHRAAAGGLDFRFVPSSAHVHSDPKLLERIVENFLDNALRYTAEGRILLGCRRSGDHLRIEVWDSGIGIPGEALKLIFEEYYQLDNPARDRAKGLGLGLALVNRLATLLGHEIDVRSTPGQGSLFAVKVPLANPETASEMEAAAPGLIEDLAGRRVLLVEDDPSVAEAARQLLEYWGLEVRAAGSAEAALATIRDRHIFPNLVIADFRLPQGESGLDLIEQIRDVLGDRIPGIVITGDMEPALAETAESRGCVLLRKPVQPEVLRFHLCYMLADRLSQDS